MGKADNEKKDELCSAEKDSKIICECDNDCDKQSDEKVDLKQQLEQLEEESKANLALAQRVQADFDNFRRRNKNISAEYLDMGVGKLALEFLSVLDNVERAICSMNEDGCPKPFIEGIDMVSEQFKTVLKKFEIVEIEAMDMKFNPDLHHAVAQEPAQEGQEKNIVVEVLQKGYKHKDKVLRYSMVKVSK